MADKNQAKKNTKLVDETKKVGNEPVEREDVVVVAENTDGEATNGTTLEGNKEPVKNTDSIPQNGVTEIETTEAPNDIAKEADEARTEEQIKFSDESNPNQKARTKGAPSEYDQDGNPRGSGYSYGVAPEDGEASTEVVEQNSGEKKEVEERRDDERTFTASPTVLNNSEPAEEVDVEKLEDELSNEKEGIKARVVSSTGNFFKIKFFKNGLPLGTYKAKTKNLDKSEVNEFVEKLNG